MTSGDDEQARTAETFDEYQSKYADAVNEAVAFSGMDVDFFTKVKAGYIEELVTQAFGDRDDLDAVDIGCGVGSIHPLLKDRFASLTGIDVSAASINRAQQRGDTEGVRYETYDGGTLPFADQVFDVTLAICVMHHVPVATRPDFVSEMRRILRPGGLALVFEHNPKNPLTMRAVNRCPFDADAVLLSSTRTTALLSATGFADVHARFILSIPAGSPALRKVDRMFSWLPFGAQYYAVGRQPGG